MRDLEKTKLLGSDFDDTVTLNSMEVYVDRLYLPVLRDIGVDIGAERFKEMVQPVWGQSSGEVIRYVIEIVSIEQGIQVSEKSILGAISAYEEMFRGGVYVDNVELVPNALEAFDAIKERGVPVGLLTGSAKSVVNDVLDKHGIPRNFFLEIISAYDISSKKPEPYSLHVLKGISAIALQSQVYDHEIVYVGDSANDVRMALAVPGVEPAVVMTGNITSEEAVAMGVPKLNVLQNVCYIEEVLERREKAA